MDVEEEEDVVGGFFDEGVGDYGDHGGEDGFLKGVVNMSNNGWEKVELPANSKSMVGGRECRGL